MTKFQSRYGDFNELPQNMLGYQLAQQWKKRLIVLSERELERLYGLEELVSAIAGQRVKIYIADYYSHKKDKLLGPVSGFSMGMYICLNSAHDLETLKHEIGHCFQSKEWGWLYLPVVGVYSAVFCNLWDRWFHKDWCDYDRAYWYYIIRWTERQADKRGRVNREAKLARIPRPANARYPAMPGQRVA
jgi:hypothetical protein